MDVRTKNRGRPHQKACFPAAPVVGREMLTPGHPDERVRNVHREFGPKCLCLCCFFFPDKPLGPCHIKNTTVILVHYGGGQKYDGVVK